VGKYLIHNVIEPNNLLRLTREHQLRFLTQNLQYLFEFSTFGFFSRPQTFSNLGGSLTLFNLSKWFDILFKWKFVRALRKIAELSFKASTLPQFKNLLLASQGLGLLLLGGRPARVARFYGSKSDCINFSAVEFMRGGRG
jgi:hypothetical protein